MTPFVVYASLVSVLHRCCLRFVCQCFASLVLAWFANHPAQISAEYSGICTSRSTVGSESHLNLDALDCGARLIMRHNVLFGIWAAGYLNNQFLLLSFCALLRLCTFLLQHHCHKSR